VTPGGGPVAWSQRKEPCARDRPSDEARAYARGGRACERTRAFARSRSCRSAHARAAAARHARYRGGGWRGERCAAAHLHDAAQELDHCPRAAIVQERAQSVI
jgi:hypothetical protein